MIIMDIFGLIYNDAVLNKNKKYKLISGKEILDEREVTVYNDNYENWSEIEKEILGNLTGKIIDLGAGAGRHSDYLNKKECEVHSVDISKRAVEIMKKRNIKNVHLMDWWKIDKKFKKEFDFAIMMFNNFAMLGNEENIKKMMDKISEITKESGKAVISCVDPEKFGCGEKSNFYAHLEYDGKSGNEFEMILLSPRYLEKILKKVNWEIEKIGYCDGEFNAQYLAVLKKSTVH
ncbi:MAG: methyltransferase domain-containing protein [Candidatus ainarchaeum sp.]|nr:methyltransferase domain-containing protein [Candidatus ainarchaeum sp.]